ncbi:MAG: FAD:protein FMN transferase [Anaerolineales bacterium]|nr:FAD:protein FMN transferase [Anaerolineales bacterium]
MNAQPYPNTWRSHSFRAMGCQMSVWLELEREETANHLLREAEAMFRRAESRLSRFDPQSELSQLNANPGSWVTVSELLWHVVLQARQMARETNGLFDPTLLNALEAAGYKTSFNNLPFWQETEAAEPVDSQLGQWEAIYVHTDGHALWLPEGIRLDLGGIAKGYVAQQVVTFLADWGPCLVDASGDLTAGAAPTGWPGWPVAVAKPSAEPLGERETQFPLWLVNGTMATSGIDYRRWQQNGRTVHHLIDPRTGQPAETDLLTATVLAKTAVRAEAWATAALVLGKSAALQRLAEKNLAAALIDQHGELSVTPTLAPFLEVETIQ